MGWSEFEDEQKKVEEQRHKTKEVQDRFCSNCYQLFELNPLGKDFMKYWEIQLYEPVFDPNKSSAEGYCREGQNRVINHIRKAISLHKINMGVES